jgi:hypothetical protein
MKVKLIFGVAIGLMMALVAGRAWLAWSLPDTASAGDSTDGPARVLISDQK